MERRDFLTTMAAGPVKADPPPWYRRVLRWGQTNINEMDPMRYDIDWWRGHWRRTRAQGVVINAGGIVASYPSRFEWHYRAKFLKGRDLYGELTRAAHDEGLVVFARMDSNRATGASYRAHPDWFALDSAGQSYRAGDLRARLLVAGMDRSVARQDGWARFDVPQIVDHEVIVV